MIRTFLSRRFALWAADKYDVLADVFDAAAPNADRCEPGTLGARAAEHAAALHEAADKLRRAVVAAPIRAVSLDPPPPAVRR